MSSAGRRVEKQFKRSTNDAVSQVVNTTTAVALGGIDYLAGTELRTQAKDILSPNERARNEANAREADAIAAADSESSSRSQAYNDALEGKNLDALSRQEILDMYSSGATSTQLATALARAKEGKGLYAIRKINENEKKIKKDMPGRSQLLGTSTIL